MWSSGQLQVHCQPLCGDIMGVRIRSLSCISTLHKGMWSLILIENPYYMLWSDDFCNACLWDRLCGAPDSNTGCTKPAPKFTCTAHYSATKQPTKQKTGETNTTLLKIRASAKNQHRSQHPAPRCTCTAPYLSSYWAWTRADYRGNKEHRHSRISTHSDPSKLSINMTQ